MSSRKTVAGKAPRLTALLRNLRCILIVTLVVKYAVLIIGDIFLKLNTDGLYIIANVLRLSNAKQIFKESSKMQHDGVCNAVFNRVGATCSSQGKPTDELILNSERRRIELVVKESHAAFPDMYDNMSHDEKVDCFVDLMKRSGASGCYSPDHVVQLFTRVMYK